VYQRDPKHIVSPHSQANAVHTPAAVPLAPAIDRSTNDPAATAKLPVTVHELPLAAEQASAVSAILPDTPLRSVTTTVFACCENTVSFVAVQAAGTHVSTKAPSLALAFVELTE